METQDDRPVELRPSPDLSESDSEAAHPSPLDRIECSGCGRWFMALDGPSMLASIKGACPDCGAHFRLGAATRDGGNPVDPG